MKKIYHVSTTWENNESFDTKKCNDKIIKELSEE